MTPEELDAIEAMPVPVWHQCAECSALATLRCAECGSAVCVEHTDDGHGGRWVAIERNDTIARVALVAEVRRLTDERHASVAAMRDIAEVVGVPYMGAVGLAGAVRMERDAAFRRGAEAMREAAAKVAAQCASERGHTQATMFAAGRPEMAIVVGIKGGEASRIEELIRALKVAP